MARLNLQCRYFTSYTGVNLPLKLVNELDAAGIDKRITYFIGYYDDEGRLKILEKLVYGEIEFSHHYEYDQGGSLHKAILLEDDELPRTLKFEPDGNMLEV